MVMLQDRTAGSTRPTAIALSKNLKRPSVAIDALSIEPRPPSQHIVQVYRRPVHCLPAHIPIR